jgi:hypothetical protein
MSSPNTTQCESKGRYRFNAIDGLCVIVLLAYFIHFALPSLAGGFGDDEMMNIYAYWRPGTLKVVWANVCFWTTFYRPCGALYYLPLYHSFSLNPQPYRIAQIGILTASIPMVWYLARLLASSRLVAFLAVLTLCYHPRLANLVFTGSFIYDVLCGFFYFAALTYYVHIREKGSPLRPMQLSAFLALYVCALNSKEMAVTLPVIVLIYELLKCPRLGDWKQFIRHNWPSTVAPLIAGLLTAVYIYGKTGGAGALIGLDAYRPRYSWHHFVTSNATFVGELLFLDHLVSPKVLPLLWAIVFIYAFIRHDRTLHLMAFWIVIVPLPLAFIPIRGGARLYLVLFGWAMIFAKVAFDLITLISKSSTSRGQDLEVSAATGAMTGGSVGDLVPGAAAIRAVVRDAIGKISPRMLQVFATVLVASGLALFIQWENQRFGSLPALLNPGQKTSHVLQALRVLDFHPPPNSTILLTGDLPFQNGWQPLFVASLFWNDPSLRIWVEGKNKLALRQLAEVNYVISLTESEAKFLPPPESAGP